VKDYRRGVLLGLSLAEVFILLLFCFLLLVAPRFAATTTQQEQETNAPPELTPDNPPTNSSPTNELPPLDGRTLVPGTPVPSPSPPEVNATNTTPRPTPTPTPTPAPKPTPVALPDFIPKPRPWWWQPTETIRIGSSSSEPMFPWKAVGPKDNPHEPQKPDKQDGEHDWPPIIPLKEAEGYKFDTGSAEVRADFAQRLRTVIKDAILETIKKYPADVIEVMGHTDERPISGTSNLDTSLIAVLSGSAPAGQLSSADNVGLGMARAAAVALVLQSCPELTEFKIIPYSGGQIIEPGDRLATGENSGDREERRRIEVRVRGSNNSSN